MLEIEKRTGKDIIKALSEKIKENKSIREIARELGISKSTIKYWIKKFGLKKESEGLSLLERVEKLEKIICSILKVMSDRERIEWVVEGREDWVIRGPVGWLRRPRIS